MSRKLPARQFLILLRDALGRFLRIRQAPKPVPARPRRRRPVVRLDAVQLVLFWSSGVQSARNSPRSITATKGNDWP